MEKTSRLALGDCVEEMDTKAEKVYEARHDLPELVIITP